MKYFILKMKLSSSEPRALNAPDLLNLLSRSYSLTDRSIEDYIESANVGDTWEDEQYLVTMSSNQIIN